MWQDSISADINKHGRVGADDAFNILKFAVGLAQGPAADWVSVDAEADWSGICRRSNNYDEGIVLDNVMVDRTVNLIGILVEVIAASYAV